MATIALAAAGNALIPAATGQLAVGQMIGALIGGFIDSAVIMPALFPPEDLESPGLGGIQIGGSQEGEQQWRMVGRHSRIPGTYIYMSDLIKQADVVHLGGGKGGGGGGSATTWDYFIDCAVAFVGNQIASYRKVWADGKLLYQHPSEGPVEVESDKISFIRTGTLGSYEYFIKSDKSGGPNLILNFFYGTNITVAGSASNDGTYLVEYAYSDNEGYSFLKVPDTLTVEAMGATVTLTQASQGWLPFVADSATFHTGLPSQAVDTYLEGIGGTDETPAFVNTSYIMFERLHLERHGNRPPIFEALLQVSGTGMVSGAIDDIMEWCGVDSLLYDVTALTSIACDGVKFRGPMSAAKMLAPLMIAYNLGVRETAGVMEFYERGDADEVTLTSDEYPCGTTSATPVDLPFKVTEVDEKRLPEKVTVNYSNEEKNYQGGSQVAKRVGNNNLERGIIDLSLVTMGADGAATIAMRVLRAAWANRFKVSGLFIPPYRIEVQEGDVLNVEDAVGESRKVLAQQVDFGANGMIEINGFYEETQMFDVVVEGGPSDPPDTKPPTVPVIAPLICALRPLRPEDVWDKIGAYQLVAPMGAEYLGGSTWVSIDGAAYEFLSSNYTEGVVGYTTEKLEAPSSAFECWDYENTVDVHLYNGSLASATKEEVAAMTKNIAVIGSNVYREVIGFVNAELIDIDTYRLSVLRRGMRSTEDMMYNHFENNQFGLLIGGTGLQLITPDNVGKQDVDFKALGVGWELGDVDPVTFDSTTYHSGGIKFPGNRCTMKPIKTWARRWPAGGGEIRWKRRSRTPFAMFQEEAPMEEPYGQPAEFYEVYVLSGNSDLLDTVAAYEVNSPLFQWNATDVLSWGYGGATDTVYIAVAEKPVAYGTATGTWDNKLTNFVKFTVTYP